MRAHRPRDPRRSTIQVPGVSRATQVAIAIAEARRLGAGSVGQAFDRYRRFVLQPGRWLYLPVADCPCCDVTDARDELETALRMLPRGPRAELSRVIAALDDEFRRRTLPDPRTRSTSRPADAWWHHRLHDQ
ncbi:hypothetical protein [Prauserella cavernicola]|uniref:Uncharacterized protein n=1 Tax=Prauserella cavernicola TaxID=2800127 RepID=A0A934QWI7_9PSEU|nr:hypothetical protein [Prauserella cavernicola]MBK1787920.1 hypothetical protein [Prauserella cavernicola]